MYQRIKNVGAEVLIEDVISKNNRYFGIQVSGTGITIRNVEARNNPAAGVMIFGNSGAVDPPGVNVVVALLHPLATHTAPRGDSEEAAPSTSRSGEKGRFPASSLVPKKLYTTHTNTPKQRG